MGTNSRNGANGAKRKGTELRCKTRNSRGTLQFDRDGQKLAARVLSLRLLPPDGQISGSTYILFGGTAQTRILIGEGLRGGAAGQPVQSAKMNRIQVTPLAATEAVSLP